MRVLARVLAAGAAAVGLAAAGAASAATIDWVDWTTVLPSQQTLGTITTSGGPVGVTFAGHAAFEQVTGGGQDNWVDDGYTQGQVNRPPGTDIIMLAGGGAETITFAKAVTDPYLALADWNNVHVTFSAPFSVVSEGCGVHGCGSFSVNGTNTGFTGVGDAYGVIKFKGTFTQLAFTDSELGGQHGFRVGLAEAGVPEPASWALMILGFGGAGAALRRRKTAFA
jgi:hypothetical protein